MLGEEKLIVIARYLGLVMYGELNHVWVGFSVVEFGLQVREETLIHILPSDVVFLHDCCNGGNITNLWVLLFYSI